MLRIFFRGGGIFLSFGICRNARRHRQGEARGRLGLDASASLSNLEIPYRDASFPFACGPLVLSAAPGIFRGAIRTSRKRELPRRDSSLHAGMARCSPALRFFADFGSVRVSRHHPRTYRARLGIFPRRLDFRAIFPEKFRASTLSPLDASGIFRFFRLAIPLLFGCGHRPFVERGKNSAFGKISKPDFFGFRRLVRVLLPLVASPRPDSSTGRFLDFKGARRRAPISEFYRVRRGNIPNHPPQTGSNRLFPMPNHRQAQSRGFHGTNRLRLSLDGRAGKIPIPRSIQHRRAPPMLRASFRHR